MSDPATQGFFERVTRREARRVETAETGRQAIAKVATDAERDRRRHIEQQAQLRQKAWASRHDRLQDRVADLRRRATLAGTQIAAADERDDIHAARIAALDLVVVERLLPDAESALAAHLKATP